MNSIRKYLITILLAAITLVNFLAALHGYRTSMQAADKVFDDKLVQMASLLRSSLAKSTEVTIDNSSEGNSSRDNTISYQVWRSEQLLTSSHNAPQTVIAPLAPGFYDVNFGGYRWRALTSSLSEDANENADGWIIAAERIDVRFTLAESVIVESVLPIVACLPIIGLIIWFVVGQGLKPLTQLAHQLSEKRSDDLSPIKPKNYTVELNQLVNSVNSLLQRLDATFEREKRFASNAAHELRTPISVLKVHLYNLQKEQQESQPVSATIQHLQQGIERLEHLVEQILTLHRTSQERIASQFSSVRLYELAQQSIGESYPLIDEKVQNVELQGDEEAVINADAFAIKALLNNLVGNASKYTPRGGDIRVTVYNEKKAAKISVEDSGPGIPEAEYDRVFERFYRVGGDRHSSGEEGCGLGLSIVKHIADLHQAQVCLSCSLTLGGLRVDVSFPKSGD